MKHYGVANSKDGWTLHLTERPWWYGIYETATEFTLGTVLRHRLCCSIPEWTYKTPIGKRDEDQDWPLEDGSLHNFNSLGSRIYRFTNAIHNFGWKREKTVAWLPITQVDAEKIQPGIVQHLVEVGWLPEDEVDPTP